MNYSRFGASSLGKTYFQKVLNLLKSLNYWNLHLASYKKMFQMAFGGKFDGYGKYKHAGELLHKPGSADCI